MPEGQIKLPGVNKGKEVEVNFLVVNAFLPYTAILGRPWIHAMGPVPYTLYQKIKFPTEDRVVVVRADQKVARQCFMVAINHEIKQKEQVDREQLQQLQVAEGLTRVDSDEELVQVRIMSYSDKYFRIGKSLPIEDQVEILLSLVQNLDLFAWNTFEVLGVDQAFIMHKLNTDPLVLPKQQRPRRSANPHMEAVKEEVEKLKQAGAINEVFFLEQLANSMVVKKTNGK